MEIRRWDAWGMKERKGKRSGIGGIERGVKAECKKKQGKTNRLEEK